MGKFEEALEKYAKYVIQQSRSNLTKAKKGGGNLYNSLQYQIDAPRVKFLSDDYGVFVDQGVRGKNPAKVSPNAIIKGQQAPNSKFKFGSGKSPKTFKQFVNKMSIWAKAKNIRFREFVTVDGKKKSTGRFVRGNYKSMGYVIASNIYNRGIRPTMFFTKPFERGLELYGDEIVEAYLEDNLMT